MTTAEDLRYELKLVLDPFLFGEARSWVYAHSSAFRVAYPPRQVNNVYFDTWDHACMDDHLAGVPARAKVRYRWYGDTWHLGGGQLEIKKKFARLGLKETYPFLGDLDLAACTWPQFHQALVQGITSAPQEILDSLRALTPVLVNRYQREYYLSMDGRIRLTLDYGTVAYQQGFGLSPNLTHPQPAQGDLVIELKAPKSEHSRIADVLSEFPQRCTANSKYLNALLSTPW